MFIDVSGWAGGETYNLAYEILKNKLTLYYTVIDWINRSAIDPGQKRSQLIEFNPACFPDGVG